MLAAGPRDETFELSGAFLNPAWLTRVSVEFSRDKEHWSSASLFNGPRDPEAVKRYYLPKNEGGSDPYEARYIRIKPAPHRSAALKTCFIFLGSSSSSTLLPAARSLAATPHAAGLSASSIAATTSSASCLSSGISPFSLRSSTKTSFQPRCLVRSS